MNCREAVTGIMCGDYNKANGEGEGGSVFVQDGDYKAANHAEKWLQQER